MGGAGNLAVGYIRVSTGDQADSGLGLTAQEQRIRAYCTAAGLNLVSIIRDEGISGSVLLHQRPGGQALEQALASGVNHIVALKLDRLFRDAEDALHQTRAWAERGVTMHLVDFGGQSIHSGNAIGRMLLTMLAAFAEFERAIISERTRQALAVKRQRGEVLGQIPYGYQRDGNELMPDPQEQAVLARILDMRQQGMSYHAIARALNAEGVPSKDAGKWHAMTVRRILQRTQP